MSIYRILAPCGSLPDTTATLYNGIKLDINFLSATEKRGADVRRLSHYSVRLTLEREHRPVSQEQRVASLRYLLHTKLFATIPAIHTLGFETDGCRLRSLDARRLLLL